MSSLFIRADSIITIYDQRNVTPVRNAIRRETNEPDLPTPGTDYSGLDCTALCSDHSVAVPKVGDYSWAGTGLLLARDSGAAWHKLDESMATNGMINFPHFRSILSIVIKVPLLSLGIFQDDDQMIPKITMI